MWPPSAAFRASASPRFAGLQSQPTQIGTAPRRRPHPPQALQRRPLRPHSPAKPISCNRPSTCAVAFYRLAWRSNPRPPHACGWPATSGQKMGPGCLRYRATRRGLLAKPDGGGRLGRFRVRWTCRFSSETPRLSGEAAARSSVAQTGPATIREISSGYESRGVTSSDVLRPAWWAFVNGFQARTVCCRGQPDFCRTTAIGRELQGVGLVTSHGRLGLLAGQDSRYRTPGRARWGHVLRRADLLG